jgi:hypothetical protein
MAQPPLRPRRPCETLLVLRTEHIFTSVLVQHTYVTRSRRDTRNCIGSARMEGE